MKAARRIPSECYVAYVGMALAIPYEGSATNPFMLSLVCQGVPRTSEYCDETPACIPIHPNAEGYGGRLPLEPCAPFPWPDCYISTFTTKNFRVTTAKRDYSPLLCLTSYNSAATAHGIISEDKFVRADFYRRRRLEDPEALARMPFSPSPEPACDPLAFLPLPPGGASSEDCSTAVSNISSSATQLPSSMLTATTSNGTRPLVDGAAWPDASSTTASKSISELGSASTVNAMLASAMFDSGSNDWPVVNIWYDLDMVSEVRDPELFMKECNMLERLRDHFEDLESDEGDHPISAPPLSSVPRPFSVSSPPASSGDAGYRGAVETATVFKVPRPAPGIFAVTAAVQGSSLPVNTVVTDVGSAPMDAVAAKAAAPSPVVPVDSDAVVPSPNFTIEADAPMEQTFPSTGALSSGALLPRSPSSTPMLTDERQAVARQGFRRSVPRRAAMTLPIAWKDGSASSALPTQREFAKLPHPYVRERPTRMASTISYAVPRLRHNSLKSQKKSRSSTSLKARRRGATLPVARSLT
ncbi:hypothetical protein PENSPDRAFT_659806 [Peniophora sp. CONT]|nr:hypothetical protein PENSPDRAFT_659806 [Peniophora sp. CONT]